MILAGLIIVLVVGGLLAWLAGRVSTVWPRWISLAALAIDLKWTITRYAQGAWNRGWIDELAISWIPQFGIRFHLAIDGLSLVLVLLTLVLGIMAVAASWSEIHERVGFFHFNLLWVLAGILGVFLALDLFLFYFFWELMLVPMYLLIGVWGHERRLYAAVKFFLFTQLSGLLMLLAILGLYFAHGEATGVYSFDYADLLAAPLAIPSRSAMLMMLGLFVAFAVKLPVVPLHTWLPDAHTEAPTAGSVVLAGLLLKTGAYGMLRFVFPLLPAAAHAFAPLAMTLAVIGILYGALLAFAQTDLKRLVAYTSVSHMGFVLLGIFAWNELALQGAIIQIICHGLSTGALFILVGGLQERTGTRDLRRMGGLWSTAPRMGGMAMFFALASLGLPGLGNFIGEFLVLLGTYQRSVPLAILASLGLIVATIYSLWIVQRVFHGPNQAGWKLADLSRRETAVLGALAALLVWLGVYPAPVLNTSKPAIGELRAAAARMATEKGTSLISGERRTEISDVPFYTAGGDP
jgi:NADH-quinone oxidoreductase subunit M